MSNHIVLVEAVHEAYAQMRERRWQPTRFPIDDGDVDDSSTKQRARLLRISLEMRDIAHAKNIRFAWPCGCPVGGPHNHRR